MVQDGQDATGRDWGTSLLDDRELLEQLKPTAALWWLAERSEHVQRHKLHLFQYEVDHGADVHATVGGFDVLRCAPDAPLAVGASNRPLALPTPAHALPP